MSISPDDITPIDDQLLAALLADDAALAAGRALEPASDGMAGDLRACLLDLESLWPRAGVSLTEDLGAFDPATASNPPRFGRFEVIEAVGRGGFGVVFRARDPRLGREVALKVPRPDVLLTAALRRRFLREARAAAALDHPQIVPVFDADMLGPFCYIASAFCEGPTLSAWLRSRPEPVPPRLAARLLRSLAEAVQHAHDRGILHRDLKPSNVLLQLPAPGRPEAEIVPRITDFGLAKLLAEEGGETEETRSQALIGSPPYMAPEQAAGKAREVGATTDVYALGATLYQVLTGRPPFEGESRSETLMQVLATEPVSPQALRPGLPRDLQTICLKCLKKDPRRRYATATALADDLGRFLRGEPIQARPASVRERAWKWARRRPSQALAVVLLALVAVGLAGGLTWSNAWLQAHNRRLQQAIDRADRHARDADRHARDVERERRLTARFLNDAQLHLADQALELGQYERAQDLLDALGPGSDGADPHGFVWQHLRRRSRVPFIQLRGQEWSVRGMAALPDGRTVAVGNWDGKVTLWDLPTERLRAQLTGHESSKTSSAFSPDGRMLANFEADTPEEPRRGAVTVWDVATARRLFRLRPSRPVEWVESFEFLSGGLLAVAWIEPQQRLLVEVWDLAADPARPRRVGQLEGLDAVEFATGGGVFAVRKDEHLVLYEVDADGLRPRSVISQPLELVDLSPDGRLIVAFKAQQFAAIIDSASGTELGRLDSLDALSPVAISADSSALAIPDVSGRVHLWDRHSRQFRTVRVDENGQHSSLRLALSPDGRRLVAVSRHPQGGGGPVTLWDVATGHRLATFPGRPGTYDVPAFTTDGQSVLLFEGASIRRWFPDRSDEASVALGGHADEGWSTVFSPDGSRLATGSDDTDEPQTIKIWDGASGRLMASWSGGVGTVAALAFHPAGRVLASGHLADGRRDSVRLWDAATGQSLGSLQGHDGRVYAVAYSPDGRTLATGGSDMVVRLWDTTTGRTRAILPGHDEKVRSLTFSADGRTLASAGNDKMIRLWDVATATPRERLDIGQKVVAIAFRSDGRALAAAGEAGALVLWDLDSKLPPRTLHGPDSELQSLALTPDGQTLAVAGRSGKIILWDTITGQELLTLEGHSAPVHGLAFAPDGSRLASCDHAGCLRLWLGRLTEDARGR